VDEKSLLDALRAKTEEITQIVATSLNLGVINDLDSVARRHLDEEVEAIIEEHEVALTDHDTIEEWQAHDERLKKTEIGRLLLARHEIAERILDLRDAALGN